MIFFSKRTLFIGSLVLLLLIIGIVLFIGLGSDEKDESEETKTEEQPVQIVEIIGQSVEGRNIEAHTFGTGNSHLLFVGGIHGGYEWNSVVLAYRMADYFEENPEVIPENISITVIPSLNPDGIYRIIGKEGRFSASDADNISRESAKPGRFNANSVDLNRNFDCKWQPESTWQGNIVSAGTEPFSEPEAEALREFVSKKSPSAVVFWHSRANAVYASECEEGILPETRNIMTAYAEASGYQAIDSFDHYEITGDAEGWLSSIGIPSVTVELESYDSIEWDRNISGVLSILEYFKN